MSRTVIEKNLSTKEARSKLATQRKPYWRSLDVGLHLGYRASHSGGAWVVRWYVGNGTYKTANLDGRPDDVLQADGATVLNWSQAQAVARDHFQRQKRVMEGHDETPAGPYTVENAMKDYVAEYRRKGGKRESQPADAKSRQNCCCVIAPRCEDEQNSKTEDAHLEEANQQWSDRIRNCPFARGHPGDNLIESDVD